MKRWWHSRSLRFRLSLWYALGGTTLLAAFSATLYLYVAQRMGRPLSYELRQEVAVVSANLAVAPDGRITWKGGPVGPGRQWSPDDPWFELWDESGRLVLRLWPFADRQLEHIPPAPAPGLTMISIYRLAANLPLRTFSIPFPGPDHQEWMLRVMRIHQPAADALSALLLIISVALPVVIAVLVLGGYALMRSWLKPLDDMAVEANRITAADFSRRLPVANPTDEIGRLATVFNVTLDRMEDAFVTLDRFVADASHELRTPLTTLRSVGEVGLRRSRTVEEYREIIGSMLEEAQRLKLLVERLLELASAEGGAETAHLRPVRLDQYVEECLDDLRILAEHREQRLVLDATPCTAETDPVLFRQALQNLVDNAIKYSPPGATIRVAVRPEKDACAVTVTDEGPGIALEHQASIAQRFFRTDRSRERTAGGVGLGLAITKAYLRVLGGTLGYQRIVPQGSVFRLTLPGGPIPADGRPGINLTKM